MEFRDYYKSLGVGKSASEKEIKQAYRKLARKFHPDVNPGNPAAEVRFKEINEAYEVLGDSEKRQKYDELGANWRLYEQAQHTGAGPPGGGAPFGQGRWTVNVGQPGGARTMTEEEMHDLFGDGDPFSDFFRTFFGGADRTGGRAGHRGRRSKAPGRDIERAIQLSLEDAFHGTTRRLSVKQRGHARSVDVRIPPGVKDGSRVRVAGEGEPGTKGSPAGDLYLQVRLMPHRTFERKGQDLYVRVPVGVTTAVLGGEAEITTIGGATVRLKIPPATQVGQVLRLRGHGMPTVGTPDLRGDLYATVDIQLPRQLTPEQRAHYEALRELEP